MALKNGDGDAAVTISEHDIVVVASSSASTVVDKGAWDGARRLRLFVRGFEGMRALDGMRGDLFFCRRKIHVPFIDESWVNLF